MAFVASVLFVAIITNSVYLLLSFLYLGGLLYVMAIATIFLLVTVDASETEEVDVLFVLKSNDRSLSVRRFINLLNRLGYNRVRFADDVGWVFDGGLHGTFDIRNMAEHAFGIVAPLAVTRETLTVIGAFEIGFFQIG